MTDIIVFHTAWMAKYDGDVASLSAGGFKFAKENGFGHEMLNFRSIDGNCYGYVPPTGNLHLEKHFDVTSDAKKVEGITVVWTAPHPEQGGRAVVGVWRNATVYREVQYPKPNSKLAKARMIDGEPANYLCTAKSEDCVILQPEVRPIFFRPGQSRNGQSWPGQQNVFYPKPNSDAEKRLLQILGSLNGSPNKTTASAKQPKPSNWQRDIERRQKIEKNAVGAVVARMEGLGFTVELVEDENRGYDLVATRDKEILHIEVKGRSGNDVNADLSVNEFNCLRSYQKAKNPEAHYRIAIVTNALEKPVVTEFVMVRGRKLAWFTLDGQIQLKFEERVAARLASVPTVGIEK